MLIALLSLLVAQSPVANPAGPIFSSPSTSGSLAFFEFAPASGRGMGTACACTTPTGAKGEAMTFARTGDATCAKQGTATTGIANGDLVVCTANQPRVESSGGVLGLRVEGARTNETLRSQQIENAVWATTVAYVAAPTITADFAVAPDGTTTADRVQIPACPNAGFDASGVNQTSGAIASPSSSSVYLKANAGNPSISVCMYGITTGTRTCTQFALNTSTWTRAVVPNVTNTGGMNMEIACENRTGNYTGATNTGAADILVWGAQSEAGAYATSYIPTVAAAVTRNEDVADFALAFSPTAGFCQAATMQYIDIAALGSSSNATGPMLTTGAAGAAITATYTWPFSGFAGGYGAIDSLGVVSAGAALWNPGITSPTNPTRYLYRHSGGVGAWTACTNGTCQTSGSSTFGTPAFTRLKLDRATAAAANFPQHIISRVQVDPSPSRCTP